MLDTHRVDRSFSWKPVIVSVAVLLVGGIGYRAASARLTRLSGSVPIPRGTLASVPKTIGEWQGIDVPLSDSVVRATGTDDHINRNYRRGTQLVSLFVAYGVRLRDLTPHRPEVCYRGAGWTLQSSARLDVPTMDGAVLPCQLQKFQRSALDAQQISVLNYYIVDDEWCADVSRLRAGGYRFDQSTSYAAQVQITAAEGVPRGDADDRVREFAADSATAIRRLLRDAVQRSAQSGP